MGMNLLQLRWDGLPTIESIDPAGPAASTSICVGDILLEVNGVSASTSLEMLRQALGNEKRAVLTLLRKEAEPLRLTTRCRSSHLEKFSYLEKTRVEKPRRPLERVPLDLIGNPRYPPAPLRRADSMPLPHRRPLKWRADSMPLPPRQQHDGQPSSEHQSRAPLDFVLQPIRELGEGLGHLGAQVGQLGGQLGPLGLLGYHVGQVVTAGRWTGS